MTTSSNVDNAPLSARASRFLPSAPTGRTKLAQGNALGLICEGEKALKGRPNAANFRAPFQRPLQKSDFSVGRCVLTDPEGQKILAGGDNHRLITTRKSALEGRKEGGMLVGMVTGGCHHRLISFRTSGPPESPRQFYADADFCRGLFQGFRALKPPPRALPWAAIGRPVGATGRFAETALGPDKNFAKFSTRRPSYPSADHPRPSRSKTA